MAEYKTAAAVFKKIEKSIKTSQTQAAKVAITATRAMYAKEVNAELGIKSARAKARSYVDMPKANGPLKGGLTILTRVMFNAQEFSPGKIKTKTPGGNRYTATYKVKGGARITLPGAFLTTVNNSSTTKKLILQRASGAKYPTKTTVVNVFKPTVEAMKPRLQNRLAEAFIKSFNDKLKYNISK